MAASELSNANTLAAVTSATFGAGLTRLDQRSIQSRKGKQSMDEPTDLLRAAEQILNKWLVDNTDGPFEEEPEIDEARTLILDAIEQMESLKCHS